MDEINNSHELPKHILNKIKQSIEDINVIINNKSDDESQDYIIDGSVIVDIKSNLSYQLNEEGDTIIHQLAKYGQLDVLKEIIEDLIANKLDKNPIVNIKNKDHYTPLHYSAAKGHLPIVEYLCQQGADSNAMTLNHFTPLYQASMNGNLSVVECLIKFGANPKVITIHGSSLLHAACIEGHYDLAKYLIKNYGAKEFVNRIDEDHYTPLHEATHSGNLELVQYLIEECNADPSIVTCHGNTILHMAAVSGNFELLKYLIDKWQANVNAIDNDGYTILHYAAMGGNKDSVAYLIEHHGLDFHARVNEFGKDVDILHLVPKDNTEVINYLKQKMNVK